MASKKPAPEQQPQPSPQTPLTQQPSGWITPEQMRAEKKASSRLPWVLVAMLTVLSLGLGGLLAAQSRELSRLRANQATPAAPAAPGGETTSSQAPSTAPSQDPKVVELLKSLPHRDKDDIAAMGKVDAPVVMVVWSDYRCPFCSVWARNTLPALKPYVDSGSLRIEHRDLVLFGDQSMAAAKAARAAGKQGKFWEYYTAVHKAAPTSGHPDIKDAQITQFAEQAEVEDLAAFKKDMASAEINQTIQQETQQAQQIGISGTPFFVINTTPLSGAQPTEAFIQTIEGYGAKK